MVPGCFRIQIREHRGAPDGSLQRGFLQCSEQSEQSAHGDFGRAAERSQFRQPLACDAAFVTLKLVSVAVAGTVCLFAFLAAAQDLSTALAALNAGRLEEAAGSLAAILRDKPDDPDANYYLGLARFRQQRPLEAAPF